MSGFAAIVNFDGQPVDRALLDRMAAYLAFRGPDEQRVWVGGWNGNVGLVHAKFATTDEGEREHQPFTVDGNAWITGHIRVDARDELRQRLAGKENRRLADATDAELLLLAYARWGETCAERLLGDYAFALWDEHDRRLWCATDHMGVRPVFYERHGDTAVVSNTLDCVRLHPDSCDELNELVIADFLVHDYNPDASSTVYARIGRLEPGSTLSIGTKHATSRRYWELPIEDPSLGTTGADVLDEFAELATKAVQDRLRTGAVALYLSGGVDSSALAAIATQWVPQPPGRLRCYCYGFERLIPDNEFTYATKTGGALGLDVQLRCRDDACFDPSWHDAVERPPQPTSVVWSYSGDGALRREVADSARVALYGEGPDNALKYEWTPYLTFLLRNHRWHHLAHGVREHLTMPRKRPVVMAGLGWMYRTLLRGRRVDPPKGDQLPVWLNRDFASRLRVAERHDAVREEAALRVHPVRPESYRSLQTNLWRRFFDWLDPAMYRTPLEVRNPYLDTRLLRFFLRLPAIPWCSRKAILRQSMHNVLPADVLTRDKTPLRADPEFEAARSQDYRYPAPRAGSALAPFVDMRLCPAGQPVQVESFYEHIRLFALDLWLSNRGWLRA